MTSFDSFESVAFDDLMSERRELNPDAGANFVCVYDNGNCR